MEYFAAGYTPAKLRLMVDLYTAITAALREADQTGRNNVKATTSAAGSNTISLIGYSL